MWQYVSLCRDNQGLLEAKRLVEALWNMLPPEGATDYTGGQAVPRHIELVNMLQVAGLAIDAALQRQESRGSHWRSDYQAADEALASVRYVFQRAGAVAGASTKERAVSHA